MLKVPCEHNTGVELEYYVVDKKNKRLKKKQIEINVME